MIEVGKREKIRERIRKAYASPAPVDGAYGADPAEGIHSAGNHVTDMSINALLERIPLRVAAYVRCKEDDLPVQVTSVEIQRHFLEERIRKVSAWTLAGTYVDLCAMNTPITDRPGFKAMVENKEKFDLVLCKSISSLGRVYKAVGNTLEELSNQGIYFYFEVEQLYTGDYSWKVILAMIASLARQECTWVRRARPGTTSAPRKATQEQPLEKRPEPEQPMDKAQESDKSGRNEGA